MRNNSTFNSLSHHNAFLLSARIVFLGTCPLVLEVDVAVVLVMVKVAVAQAFVKLVVVVTVVLVVLEVVDEAVVVGPLLFPQPILAFPQVVQPILPFPQVVFPHRFHLLLFPHLFHLVVAETVAVTMGVGVGL